MIIDIARMDADGEDLEGKESPSIFEIDDEDALKLDAPLRYKLHAYLAGNDLIVSGQLDVEVRFRCSRCSELFPVVIAEPDFRCVVDVEEDCESVDLTAEMREAMLLCFPSYPVCGSECRGLCAQCGANLNKAPCDCEAPPDDRWGALDGLGS